MMRKTTRRTLAPALLALILLLLSACKPGAGKKAAALPAKWETIETMARGTTVNMMMWTGDPLINAYMRNYVVEEVRKRYDITLNLISGQGNIIVQSLMAEMQANKPDSELDLLWINGETFYQLRQIDALYGPWTDKLPNSKLIDWGNPFIANDFQQPLEGYECPWGNVQMAIIYDTAKVPTPPRTRQELADFVRTNPGKFTFDLHFTGLTFLKALLMDIAGGPEALAGPFDEEKYRRYSAELWEYLRSIQPYLWREGRTFPDHVASMHRYFANGELWFTMSNNDCEVDNKIRQGLFPATARAYVPDFGSIQNSHYLGIPARTGNPAGAAVVANFMISPEAQYMKQDPTVWGDGTVLNISALPDDWPSRFAALPVRQYGPSRKEMQEKALPEPAPEYMIRLAEDFRKVIIEQR